LTTAIGKVEIAALIPHAGAMCLLDSVVGWDSTSITCLASGHRDANNPLASDGRLDCVCGIEYAAQAMAVHFGLTAGQRPASGYLASVRDVICHVERLDLLSEDIEVTATRLAGDASSAVYGFRLRCGEAMILEGRMAVVLDAGEVGMMHDSNHHNC
jgi:predicted hotdog family 3-hydroxylacyl-ACP dehydratase